MGIDGKTRNEGTQHALSHHGVPCVYADMEDLFTVKSEIANKLQCLLDRRNYIIRRPPLCDGIFSGLIHPKVHIMLYSTHIQSQPSIVLDCISF